MECCWYFKFKGTVIIRIWWQIILVILYTSIVASMHEYVAGLRMEFKQTLIPILGVVTGLLLVFRTNTAYDRYWEGRRLWSQMTSMIRTLARGIWTGVKVKEAKDVIEKKSALNILVGFAVATKHYLREEYSADYDDLKDLIGHLYAKRSAVVSLSGPTNQANTFRRSAHDREVPSNIPVELSHHIACYLSDAYARGLIESPILTPMQNALTALVDNFTGFERIRRTPIPLAYSVHLQHSVWLYLLALPYQLVNDLGWWTVPAVALASFSLLGILEIGWEIENPFGYDENDLPLDDFCRVLRSEMEIVSGNKRPTIETWVFNTQNYPFGKIGLNAIELSNRSVDEVNDFLFQNAQAHKRSILVMGNGEPHLNAGFIPEKVL